MYGYRTDIMDKIKGVLLDYVDGDEYENLSNDILNILKDYEFAEKSTELAIYDDFNEKTLKRYATHLFVSGKSQGTIKQYVRACKIFAETIGRNFNEIQDDDPELFLFLEKKRGVSDCTLENTRSYIASFYHWMALNRIIKYNAWDRVKPIKSTQKVKMPFSSIDIDMIRRACANEYERALIELLLSSGIRVNELVNLEITDINFDNLSVHVRQGKGDKERVTYMTEIACMHLKNYLMKRDDGVNILLSHKGQKYNTNAIREQLNRISERSNVDNVHPHRFRRTFATNLANRGMDIQEIRRLMGHTDINTTLKYVYTSDVKIHQSYLQCS